VAAELIDWVDQTGIDGFNLARIVTPESYADFIEWVVPELQQRKRYKTAYASGVWREKIFNTQAPYLNAPHPAGFGGCGKRMLMNCLRRKSVSSLKTCFSSITLNIHST